MSDIATDAVTLPPQAVEAEQSLLGSLLLDQRAMDDIESDIEVRDFYRSDHQHIFKAIQELNERDDAVDVVTVSEELDKDGKLKQIGGLAYLGALVKNTPNSGNIHSYAKIVRERAILRRLIQTSNDIIEKAYHPDGMMPAHVLDYAEQAILKIAQQEGNSGQTFDQIESLLAKSLDKIQDLYENGSLVTGISTGFTKLDQLTTGLHPGELVIVAGRPSMGKTSFSMNIVENAAVRNNTPVAIYSMEMPGDQISTRMLSSLSRINSNKLRTGRLSESDFPKLMSTMNIIKDKPIYVDDSAGLSPLEVRSRARRLASKLEGGLGLIVIDYLQLMAGSGDSDNRTAEISDITRSLKALAKELEVPIVVLSQLNRSLEQRPNKRPIMSDLRESGAIEQDADLILFIYRDEVYNKDSEAKGSAEIIIGKQRNGPIDTVKLKFLGEFTKFEDFSVDTYSNSGVVPDSSEPPEFQH